MWREVRIGASTGDNQEMFDWREEKQRHAPMGQEKKTYQMEDN